jgi:putative transposase
MARLARIIVPDCPHHVTQRGNRREPIFFEDGDQEVYRGFLAEQTRKRGVEVWGWRCLMPNHVHLILAPSDESDSGSRPARRTNATPTSSTPVAGGAAICSKNRFASVVMDEDHLLAAARCLPMNPVRARLGARPRDWPWSNARAHLAGAAAHLVGPIILLT